MVLLGFGALVTFLLGAGPAYLFVRYRLVLPVLLSAYLTGQAVVDRGAVHSAIEAFFVPLFALVFVGVVGGIALAEYVVRERTGIAPPRPL